VLRLPAVHGARPRTAADRRRHREAALARHLAGARTVWLEATHVALRSVTGAPVPLEALGAGTLVALRGGAGQLLALGVVEAVDAPGARLAVRTTATGAVVELTIGETTAAA
jgi:polynucleotide 5'-kinase involved in rRNA processing